MILKTLAHKGKNGTRRLVEYILDDHGNGDKTDTFTYAHFLRGVEPEAMIAAFTEHQKHLPKRKNRVWRYHEVMSFSPHDRPHLTEETLLDLTKKYIELRCPENLVLARPHLSKDHVHVHLMISANALGQKKALHLSRSQFMEIRRDMERYQMEHYPELSHSLVYVDEKERKKSHDKDPTKVVQSLCERASSLTDFERLLERENMTLYRQRGKPKGIIIDGKKHRFARLGIEPERIDLLERLERLERAREMSAERSRSEGYGREREL